MSRAKIISLTCLALVAFAANSLLCRAALRTASAMDPASFTLLRITAGALMLALIMLLRRTRLQGDWWSALALFVYAAAFSIAYMSLNAPTGALLLFGAVQATMIGYGLLCGERLRGLRLIGFLIAVAGVCALLLPGVQRPPVAGSIMMLSAGIAWGVYSLRGKHATDPAASTAGNFVMACVPALLFWMLAVPNITATEEYYATARIPGSLAILSGAVTSGLGYVIWYAALRGLKTTEAATVQLSVPVITAAGGVLLLGETASWRLVICGIATLGGIALVVCSPPKPQAA